MRIRTFLRNAVPLLAVAALLGCTDAGSPSGDSVLPTLTEAGFYPLLSSQSSQDDGHVVTLSLKQVPGGIELASVQGEITYDAALLQLSRATLPQGVEGDAEEVSPGRVRFVGTMMEGATEPLLLQLELRGRNKPVTLTREMFVVQIEEVTGGADLADLTGTVRADRLLFVKGR